MEKIVMSEIMIHLKLEPWLRQWLLNEQGPEPISFERNSTENDILFTYLSTLPKHSVPDQPSKDTVSIMLPTFKKKDVRWNNYLSPSGRAVLKRCIRARLTLALWNDLSRFGNIGKQKQDLIWAWMESNGIETTETNFFALQKIYQRRREAYLKRKNREKTPRLQGSESQQCPVMSSSVHQSSKNDKK